MTFEKLTINSHIWGNLLKYGLTVAGIIFLLYLFLAKFFPHFAKGIFPYLKWYMNIAKLLTCLIAIFLVFCYNYETKKVEFFVSLDGMNVSTFLVGALAIWEIVAFIADMLSVINDKLPDR